MQKTAALRAAIFHYLRKTGGGSQNPPQDEANPLCSRVWPMKKTISRSNASRVPAAGALDMAIVQIVSSIEQTRLRKGLLLLWYFIVPSCCHRGPRRLGQWQHTCAPRVALCYMSPKDMNTKGRKRMLQYPTNTAACGIQVWIPQNMQFSWSLERSCKGVEQHHVIKSRFEMGRGLLGPLLQLNWSS